MRPKFAAIFAVVAVATAASTLAVAASHAQKSATVARETLLAKFAAQPSNAPGMTLTTVVAEYSPGSATPSHRHGSAFAMVYILEGTIVSKVDDGPETVLHAGDHFTEAPGAHHVVFINPSSTQTAKVVATFLAPTAEAQQDLSILDN